ncbi:tRNA uridine 5-oxyacetic acid(34) methyltransferase CmoM [Shewanella pneumatophori]|uniref:tRNA 5-carboxymethoxyuridine methyltransferase n=1 Tax=Shewanella pneumatophori TaxID=314092 RepID=A0A9X2CGC8_9GAMM|nr:tRNA uridine 5-oxyacetic acid(34) methyltransferase CmoM [Shewanella pneumatophori]
MKQDRNFDDLAHKFAASIYGTAKGEIRQTVVWQDIELILKELAGDNYQQLPHQETAHQELKTQPTFSVLDAGGGLAQLSQKIAALGHNVNLCDLSSEMLSLAKQDITANNLLERYRFIHSPVQHVSEHLNQPVDLVLFHAVMEWLAEPIAALTSLCEQVKPGGIISVMFYNYNGLLFKNLICGNLKHIEQGMPHRKRFKLQPQQGIKPELVYQCLQQAGFEIIGKTGVRTFHDYMQNHDMGHFSFDEIVAMEQKLCRQEPFLSLGRYIHVYAKKKS